MARRLRLYVAASVALILASGVLWWAYHKWNPAVATRAAGQATPTMAETSAPSTKIIVGEQAQKNLGLTAKPLQAETFWKFMTVPGMVVDRPGMSDREVAAPVIGAVTEIHHVPGDTVRPGEKLFTLRLASESLQQTQAELFKASQNLKLSVAKRERLTSGGEAIAGARLIEAEAEIAKLQASIKAFREELSQRALSPTEIEGVADGKLVREVSIVAPPPNPGQSLAGEAPVSSFGNSRADEQPFAYELQKLTVGLGEQVQAGATLCHLSSHKSLAIEGRAFRDETSLLERSIEQAWPVEIDFEEDPSGDWPEKSGEFPIRYISNTIDPVTRTFAFLMPLENQYKEVRHGDTTQLLWRFRPGQKVRVRVRVEKLEKVFVVPADAVVFEGPDSYVFTQNVNTFERKSVHVVYHDQDRAVIEDDGSLPAYAKGPERRTIPAVALTAAAQLNRMTKSGAGAAVPKGYHIHADGSLHKNEDDAK